MAKTKKPDQEDGREDGGALLERAFRDVTPLPGRRISPAAKTATASAKPLKKLKSNAGPRANPVPRSSLPELTHGNAPGVDKRTAQRLKRGKMAVEGRLDLHGHTQTTGRR